MYICKYMFVFFVEKDGGGQGSICVSVYFDRLFFNENIFVHEFLNQ